MRQFLRVAICTIALAAARTVQAQSSGDMVGSAVVATNEVSLTLDTTETPIAVGDPILFGGVIRTGLESANVDTFLDDTSLSVGPSSEVLINRFVYSETQGGQAVVRLLQGTLRVATGEVRELRVETPFATIGVRGTVFVVSHDETNGTIVIVEDGAVDVANRGGDGVSVEAGFASTVPSPTSPPSAPSTPSGAARAAVANLNSALSVFAGTTLGAPVTVTTLTGNIGAANAAAAETDATSGAFNFGGDGRY